VHDGLRARVLCLAPEGRTAFDEAGLCLYRYGQRTALAQLTSRGVGFCLVLQGSKQLETGVLRLQAEPGQMIVVARDAALQAVVNGDDNGDPYVALSVWFDPERVARALLRLAELEMRAAAAEEPNDVPAFTTIPAPPIVEAIERLLVAAEDPVDRKTIAPLVLDELMFRLLRTEAAAAVRAGMGPPQEVARIVELMQFIRENHTRKLTVALLAKKAAMSSSHFAHQFSRIAHMSPMKYVREVRLERAKTLLGEQGTRPSEVAQAVGFESAAHFTRQFKRRYGSAPSHYRGRAQSAGRR
jgi:AraC-like DNA-binding protein